MRSLIFVFLITIHSCSSSTENEDFNQFLLQFSIDSTFQTSRIDFPLIVLKPSEDFNDVLEKFISQDNWKTINVFYSNYCVDLFPQVYDSFEYNELKDTNERVLAWRGIESGESVFYFFKKRKGQWRLVKIEDFST